MANTDDNKSRIENALERGAENAVESARERQEQVFERADKMKKSTSVFWIVVNNLAEKGYHLPSDQIKDIKTMYAGKDYVVVKFNGDISLTFDKDSDMVLSKIKEDAQMLEGTDAAMYRNKYLDYALRFLDEMENVLDGGSSLAAERLSRLGI